MKRTATPPVRDEVYTVSQIQSIKASNGHVLFDENTKNSECYYDEELGGESFKFMLKLASGEKLLVKPVELLPEEPRGDYLGDTRVAYVRELIGSQVYKELAPLLGFKYPETKPVKITMKSGKVYNALSVQFINEFSSVESISRGRRVEYNITEGLYLQHVLRMFFGDTDCSPANTDSAYRWIVDAGCFGQKESSSAENFIKALSTSFASWNKLVTCHTPGLSGAVDDVLEKLSKIDFDLLFRTVLESVKSDLPANFEHIKFSIFQDSIRRKRSYTSVEEMISCMAENAKANIIKILPELKDQMTAKVPSGGYDVAFTDGSSDSDLSDVFDPSSESVSKRLCLASTRSPFKSLGSPKNLSGSFSCSSDLVENYPNSPNTVINYSTEVPREIRRSSMESRTRRVLHF